MQTARLRIAEGAFFFQMSRRLVMRKLLLMTVALSLVVFAALPSSVSAGSCNPYTQGAWSLKTPVNTNIVRAWGAFFPGNGNFYAMGGRFADGVGNDLLNPREYNPTTQLWTTKAAAFPSPEVNNMVGGVLNMGGTDVIVVVGGSAGGQVTATAAVRTYNPVTDILTTLTAADNWPGNASGTILPGGAGVFANKLYVFGGFDINVGMTTQIWQFDPAQPAGSRWSLKAASLPPPGLGYIPTATSGNFIYLTGGSAFDPTVLLVDTNSSLRYDPTADAITTIATIPRATAETRAVRHPFDGSIWVLGGGRTAPNPSNEVDVYNPTTNSWTLAPPFANARRNFPADIDPVDGRIWAAGGYASDGVTPLNVNEQFTCTVPVDLTTFGVE
jgi:hypothetical protein